MEAMGTPRSPKVLGALFLLQNTQPTRYLKEMKTILIACEAAKTVPFEELNPFQGNLKTLAKEDSEKLKKEIVETGFAFPMYIWENGGKVFIVGGHQRYKVLESLKAEGYEIPSIPVVSIKADSYQGAKRRIMQDAAQYGKINGQGLHDFIIDAGFNIEDFASSFSLPEVSISKFMDEFFKEKEHLAEQEPVISDREPQITTPEEVSPKTSGDHYSTPAPAVSNVKMVQLFFTEATQPEFVQKVTELQEKYGQDNLTDTVMEIVREAHSTHFPS